RHHPVVGQGAVRQVVVGGAHDVQHAVGGDGHRTGGVPGSVRPVEHAVNHVRAHQRAADFLQVGGGNGAVERERAALQRDSAAASNNGSVAEIAAVVQRHRAA